MTTPANNLPVSIDYTGRDYYSLRSELISRVQANIPAWSGTDPSDFGLALIESFAYMGDLINYYIDRAANESYIMTATQRQSLINLAQMYGYEPTGYVGAATELSVGNTYGYQGAIGGSQISTLDYNQSGTATDHVAEIIVPADHPFVVGNYAIISGVAGGNITGSDPSEINHNVFDGTWEIIGVGTGAGEDGQLGAIYFKPEFTIANIVGDGTTVTITTTGHQLAANQSIVISGVTPSTYNGTYSVATVDTVNRLTFTITSDKTTAYSSGGKINYSDVDANYDILGYAYLSGTITLPAGAQISTQVSYADKIEEVVFTTQSDAVMGLLGNPTQTVTVQAVHGENVAYRAANLANTAIVGYDINGEKIGKSNGTADQSFTLAETEVNKTLVEVYVDSGTSFVKWTQVAHLTDYGPNSAVFTVTTDADGFVYVNFGDGISGAIPPQDATIKSVYYKGGGPVGNVDAYTLNTLKSVPSVTTVQFNRLKQYVRVTNTSAATGGTNPESNDSIRYNAPRALRTINRAVSLNDYANLALSLEGVGKANATAEIWSSVTLYVSPSQTDDVLYATPGMNGSLPTDAWYRMQTRVQDYLADKAQIGTTVTVQPPTYTLANVGITYTKLPQYTNNVVESNLKSYIVNAFSYNYVVFEDVITPEEMEFKLRQVEGIQNIKVTDLYKDGGSGRNSLIGGPDELFVFLENNITLTAAPTDSTLSGLTVDAGTLTPSFSPSVFAYTVPSLPSGTGTIAVGVTATDTDYAHITVNDSAVDANAGSASVATPVGLTYIVVSVTAGDGVSVTNYRLTVNRGA